MTERVVPQTRSTCTRIVTLPSYTRSQVPWGTANLLPLRGLQGLRLVLTTRRAASSRQCLYSNFTRLVGFSMAALCKFSYYHPCLTFDTYIILAISIIHCLPYIYHTTLSCLFNSRTEIEAT